MNSKHRYLKEVYVDQIPFPFCQITYHKFDMRDTFSLRDTFVNWLYECLRYFQEEASKTVDFSFHTFDIDGDTLTQAECIDRMINDCKVIMLNDDDEERFDVVNNAKNDLFKVFSIVYWSMWW